MLPAMDDVPEQDDVSLAASAAEETASAPVSFPTRHAHKRQAEGSLPSMDERTVQRSKLGLG